ncbi:MAG: hypothetical protein HC869_24905 [Rhodospirillales bacterium]|nr:hypothetical protein [Rhodospirillales bacterium]
MDKQSRFSIRSVATVLLSYGVLVGGGLYFGKNVIVPALTGASSNQSGVLDSSENKLDSSPLTLLGDTFSGYRLLQSDSFQESLRQSGTQLVYRNEVNQVSRAKALETGKADLILTTLDQFLQNRPKGQIVGLINRTVGADAAVLNSKSIPSSIRSLI